MVELSLQYPRYGYRRIAIFLRRDEHAMSFGRAHRLWREAKLQLPKKRGRKRVAGGRPRPNAPSGPNQVWSYDFVFDWCANGQKLKCLTVSDEWTKEGLAIEVDGRIRSPRVIECLSLEWFRSRAEAKALIETWRRHFNEVRPHSSLGYMTPNEFVASIDTNAATVTATERTAAVCGASALRSVAQPLRQAQTQKAETAACSN